MNADKAGAPKAAEALINLVPRDAAIRLLAFRRAINAALPSAVRDVILFGSRARGDARPDSDYDVAVLLADDLAEHSGVRCRLADAAWEHVIAGYKMHTVALPTCALALSGSAHDELSARVAADGASVRSAGCHA